MQLREGCPGHSVVPDEWSSASHSPVPRYISHHLSLGHDILKDACAGPLILHCGAVLILLQLTDYSTVALWLHELCHVHCYTLAFGVVLKKSCPLEAQ